MMFNSGDVKRLLTHQGRRWRIYCRLIHWKHSYPCAAWSECRFARHPIEGQLWRLPMWKA
jgi:hypothetical protein